MRTLIDGYNLMYTLGLLEKPFGPDGFRKARIRFLNDLAAGLGAEEAHRTTVVFDARSAPPHLPRESSHKGITVLYADEEEGADARIERLIAAHSVPKSLTVVSTDRRIRQAAARRRARVLTAEAFWEELEAPPGKSPPPPKPIPTAEEEARLSGLSPEESAEWVQTFAEAAAEAEAEAGQPLDPYGSLLSDADIARIEREVDDEFRKRG